MKAKLIKKKDMQPVAKKVKRTTPTKRQQDSFSIDVRVKIQGRGSEASKARSTWNKLFGG